VKGHRYLPLTEQDRREMLEAIGVTSIDDLFADIPEEVRFKGSLNLPPALSELELVRHMKELAGANATVNDYACFMGAGAYDHFIPTVVDAVLSRGEFYSAYTPYQPEVSQGTLQTIYEYQTLICELTSMDIAQASMYDGATALAEAALMACVVTRRPRIIMAESIHPEYLEVIRTYTQGRHLELVTVGTQGGRVDLEALERTVDKQTACVLLQTPNFFGLLEDGPKVGEVAHKAGALFVVCTDPISLGVLKPPGEYGADIVVGEGQPLGNPLSFGGPYLGFFAAREKFMRRMPGRMIAMTEDNRGQRGFVMALQTREQHIRREKATSNICTNEALCALAACVYLCAMGRQGFRQVAELCLQKAHYAAERISGLEGFELAFEGPFFKEFTVKCPLPADQVVKDLLSHRILAGVPLGRFFPEMRNHLLVCVTEKRTKEEIDHLVRRLEGLA